MIIKVRLGLTLVCLMLLAGCEGKDGQTSIFCQVLGGCGDDEEADDGGWYGGGGAWKTGSPRQGSVDDSTGTGHGASHDPGHGPGHSD